MKRLALSCYALSICAAPILLSGCGGSQTAIGVPGAQNAPMTNAVDRGSSYMKPTAAQNLPVLPDSFHRTSASENLVYSFRSTPDGNDPFAGLINVKGELYGTTSGGGKYNGGTVFRINLSGEEEIVHNFGRSSDGEDPEAGLIEVNGTFYGTTCDGGKYGYGTVFKVTPSGKESILYSFTSALDTEYPSTSLVEAGGALYGTTEGYNGKRLGTVYRVTLSGKETVIHRFRGSPDGATPYASLIAVNGKLYGTTLTGGAAGFGTVFTIGLSGKEKVIYSFAGSPDGAGPEASLVDVGGTLYGTTPAGGLRKDACSYFGSKGSCGTVFSITPSGKERVIYKFRAFGDGVYPVQPLVEVGGALYGTADGGTACFQILERMRGRFFRYAFGKLYRDPQI